MNTIVLLKTICEYLQVVSQKQQHAYDLIDYIIWEKCNLIILEDDDLESKKSKTLLFVDLLLFDFFKFGFNLYDFIIDVAKKVYE